MKKMMKKKRKATRVERANSFPAAFHPGDPTPVDPKPPAPRAVSPKTSV